MMSFIGYQHHLAVVKRWYVFVSVLLSALPNVIVTIYFCSCAVHAVPEICGALPAVWEATLGGRGGRRDADRDGVKR